MNRILRRDAQAFEIFFDRFERQVKACVHRIVRDSAAAEDLVQEVFLRLWNRADQWECRGTLQGWLLRIGTNLAYNAGDHSSALKLYQQMDRLDPSTPVTLARLGSTWARLGEHEKALEMLRRAARLAEQAQPAGVAGRWIQRDVAIFSRLKAGESLLALGRSAQARRQLERAVEIADCPDCTLQSREAERSRSRAEALLADLTDRESFPAAPAPAP